MDQPVSAFRALMGGPTAKGKHICKKGGPCPHLSPEHRADMDAYWEVVTTEMIADAFLDRVMDGWNCRECGARIGHPGSCGGCR